MEADLVQAVGFVVDEIAAVFASLEALGREFADGCASATAEERQLACANLGPYKSDILAILDRFPETTAGAGLIVVPGILADAQRWIDWWWREPGQPPKQLKVNVNPTSPDSLDYAAEEWFARPAESGMRTAVGPYVDYLCTNDYTVTLSVPIDSNGIVAIAAADILVASIEAMVLPAFCQADFPVLLINELGRVIVSNLPDYPPGCRIARPSADGSGLADAQLVEIVKAAELGWTLLGAI